jgi:hypothetical protein
VRPAALAAAALLAAGCGGDEGGDRATYERDGEAICADYEAAIDRLDAPQKLTEIGPYLARALPVLERAATRLDRLDPPGELREEHEAFRDAARATAERARALRDAASKADAAEVRRLLAEAAKASTERVELARAAGLPACADV